MGVYTITCNSDSGYLFGEEDRYQKLLQQDTSLLKPNSTCNNPGHKALESLVTLNGTWTQAQYLFWTRYIVAMIKTLVYPRAVVAVHSSVCFISGGPSSVCSAPSVKVSSLKHIDL